MPVLTGQDIGQAHFATRALLERQLGGLPFEQWTALNLAGRSALTREALMQGLKLDAEQAAAVVDGLAGRGLATPAGEITPVGRAEFERVTAAIARIVETVYGGIPEEDQAVARRVLGLVRERADAALAG